MSEVTAGDVDRVLRRSVWPLLKSAGMARRGRTAWSEHQGVARIVTIRSLGSSQATSLRHTSASVSVELAVRFVAAAAAPWDDWPATYDPKGGTAVGDARKVLVAPQSFQHPDLRYARGDVWYVDPTTDLGALGVALAAQLEAALVWLVSRCDRETAIESFEHSEDGAHETYGGNLASLHRTRVVCFLAHTLGQPERALRAIAACRSAYHGLHDVSAELSRWERAVKSALAPDAART